MFTHHPSGTAIHIIFQTQSNGTGGRFYIKWNITSVSYTKLELKKLHKQFGHPANKALVRLLDKANPASVNEEVKESLKEIVRKCKPCQTFTPRSTQYRVALPMHEIVFNHEIEVDVMWVDSEPILHLITRVTRYSVCKYITCSQTAENLWNMILEF